VRAGREPNAARADGVRRCCEDELNADTTY
jgi:hypothetical protein